MKTKAQMLGSHKICIINALTLCLAVSVFSVMIKLRNGQLERQNTQTHLVFVLVSNNNIMILITCRQNAKMFIDEPFYSIKSKMIKNKKQETMLSPTTFTGPLVLFSYFRHRRIFVQMPIFQ